MPAFAGMTRLSGDAFSRVIGFQLKACWNDRVRLAVGDIPINRNSNTNSGEEKNVRMKIRDGCWWKSNTNNGGVSEIDYSGPFYSN